MAVCSFADQSRRFDRYYRGSYVSGVKYRGVAHSTETTGLPSYSGGAMAPHFTVDPKSGKVWQHYDTNRPSRALEHRPGTIDTNNMRAVQVEIIAYSDHSEAKKVGGLYVGDFTPTHIAHVARLFRWIESACKIPSRVLMPTKTYPASYGDGNGVRFTDSAWKKANGWCEHQNVPHNNHGDAGALGLPSLMATTPTKTSGDDPVQTVDLFGTTPIALTPGVWTDLSWLRPSDGKYQVSLFRAGGGHVTCDTGVTLDTPAAGALRYVEIDDSTGQYVLRAYRGKEQLFDGTEADLPRTFDTTKGRLVRAQIRVDQAVNVTLRNTTCLLFSA